MDPQSMSDLTFKGNPNRPIKRWRVGSMETIPMTEQEAIELNKKTKEWLAKAPVAGEDTTFKENVALFSLDPKIFNIKLLGDKILIRLFKKPKVDTKSNLYIPDLKIRPSEGQTKMEAVENDWPYQNKGVVVSVSNDINVDIKPFDVVVLNSIILDRLDQAQVSIDPSDIMDRNPNYFRVSPGTIEWLDIGCEVRTSAIEQGILDEDLYDSSPCSEKNKETLVKKYPINEKA